MATRKIVSKHVNVASGAYVGRDGELWVNTVTNTMKISDGTTPGGATLITDGSAGATAWATITDINNASGPDTVTIGRNAGAVNQGTESVAIGDEAGKTSQGVNAVAIGNNAAETNQGASAVSIGDLAGNISQTAYAVAIGVGAGYDGQKESGVAIGKSAGYTTQGVSAVALGQYAGKTNQAANSIVINATGVEVNNTTASSLVIKPIRSAVGTTMLMYDATTGEVTHTASPVITGDITGSVFGDDSTLLVDAVNGVIPYPANAGVSWDGVAPTTVDGALDRLASYTQDFAVSTDAHWADPNPTGTTDAINRLAAAIYALNGNTGI